MARIQAIRAAAAAAALAAAPMAAPAAWAQDAPAGQIQFVNDSSYTVTITVDGNQVCVVSPGNTCSTVVATAASNPADDHVDHPVYLEADTGDTYDDSFQVWECDGNRDGIKSYFISDDWVDFECW